MNYDTFLFSGHGISSTNNSFDSGAVNGQYVEADITALLVANALTYLKNLPIKIHTSSNNFTDQDTKNNTYKYKCGLSVHINSGGGRGSEIFVPLGEKYIIPDITLLNSLNSVIGLNNRGVKSREYNSGSFINRQNGVAINGLDYYGEIRTAWRDGISLSLLEVGFIDTEDINIIMNNIDNISYLIASYIATLCGLTLPPTAPTYSVIIKDLHIKDEAERLLKEFKCRGYNSEIKEY